MNRQREIENAARRIKALKELTKKHRVTEKLAELEKEGAWKRKENQTLDDKAENMTLKTIQKLLDEKYYEIIELRDKLKNNKASNLSKIELGLKDIENTLIDFNRNDEDVFFAVNGKLNVIKDLRLGLRDDTNLKKMNQLKQLVDILEDAKLIVIKIDEEPQWPFENVD